jgi:hypothetical protein
MGIRILVPIGIALALAAGAQAATLVAGPLRLDDSAANGDVLDCSVVNVSDGDVEVMTTAVLDDSLSCGPFTLPPGGRTTCQNSNASVGAVLGPCVFEVGGGKRKVRASACALDGNFNCRAALQAS